MVRFMASVFPQGGWDKVSTSRDRRAHLLPPLLSQVYSPPQDAETKIYNVLLFVGGGWMVEDPDVRL